MLRIRRTQWTREQYCNQGQRQKYGSGSIPVNDSSFVKENEATHDFGRIETRARLLESASLLDLEQEITAIHVLHDEKELVLRPNHNKRVQRAQPISAFNFQIDGPAGVRIMSNTNEPVFGNMSAARQGKDAGS